MPINLFGPQSWILKHNGNYNKNEECLWNVQIGEFQENKWTKLKKKEIQIYVEKVDFSPNLYVICGCYAANVKTDGYNWHIKI